MKKLGYILATIVAICFASCDELPTLPTTQSYLTAATSSLQLEAANGMFFLEIDSNIEWRVSSSAEWLTPSQTEFSGADNAPFSYSANQQNKSRSALIKVEPKNAGSAEELEILVIQKGNT